MQTFEFLFQHKDETFRVLEAIGKSINPDSAVGIVLNARDVKRKEAETAIEKLASFPRVNPNPIFELAASGELNRQPGWKKLPSRLENPRRNCCRQTRPPWSRNVFPAAKAICIAKRRSGTGFFRGPIFQLSQARLCIAMRWTLRKQLRFRSPVAAITKNGIGRATGRGSRSRFQQHFNINPGYSGLLLSEENLNPDFRRTTSANLHRFGARANLTRQLLMFSRKQMMQPHELDLNEVIGNVTKLLRRFWENRSLSILIIRLICRPFRPIQA